MFGDRGYVSQPLATQLFENFGIEFFAKPKRNMKNRLMRLTDKLLSRKRSVVKVPIATFNYFIPDRKMEFFISLAIASNF